MILRAGLFLIILAFWASCSDKTGSEAIEQPFAEQRQDSPSNAISKEYSIVCGVLFTVADFNQWQKAYIVEAQNSIIYLNSTNDSNIVLVFEANQTLEKAKARVSALIGDAFTGMAGVKGTPVASYYHVIYYKQAKISDKNFLALSFRIKDNDQLDLFGKSQFEQFSELGMRPIGMGSNPIKADEVYMLFTINDIDLIHQKSDTPGKLKGFLSELNLPTDASMSYWVKP